MFPSSPAKLTPLPAILSHLLTQTSDIKPHNFVLTSQAHLQLIDFGCAAPLLPPSSLHGRRAVPKPYCLVPCGTCDYISPEILQAHEDALFAVEMDNDGNVSMTEEGYGCETDWWSLGAVIYELAMGVAPFFAPDIKQTYSLIVDHEVCCFVVLGFLGARSII